MKRLSSRAVAALAFVLLVACSRKPRNAPSALAPLTTPSWLVELPVTGFAPARVAVPLGARSPKPLLLALHGDDDRPEWTCGSYRAVAGSHAFVLCPAGSPRPDGRFGLASRAETARELRAALPVLKQRFGAYLARGSIVLAALGPSVDTLFDLALEEPRFFSSLVLVDPPLTRLNGAFATRFGEGGGRRVLVICGAGACPGAEAALRVLSPVGVEAHLVRSEGHGLDAAAVALLAREWPWLTSGDSRFR